jgi:Domain of unknown function (DUF4252)
MRTILLLLSICFFQTALNAQDKNLYWKYKDYDGAIAFRVPGLLAKVGSLFLKEKAQRRLLRRTGSVRILVFEDNQSPVKKKDIDRLVRRTSSGGGLDELITVRAEGTRVHVFGQERNNKIKKLAVLVQEDDTFVFVSVRGNYRISDIIDVVNDNAAKAKSKTKSKKKDRKPVIPIKTPEPRV